MLFRSEGRLPLTGRLAIGRIDPRRATIELPFAALEGRHGAAGREAERFSDGDVLRAALFAGRMRA